MKNIINELRKHFSIEKHRKKFYKIEDRKNLYIDK